MNVSNLDTFTLEKRSADYGLYRSVKAIFKACREHEGLHSDRRGYEDCDHYAFFSMLGYDVFNPQEFVPEFTADVGIKKGEKVDYAIIRDGQPVILIECKSISENLDRHDSQLFRYFGTTTAKFAILTNGIIYRFYTDLTAQTKWMMIPS